MATTTLISTVRDELRERRERRAVTRRLREDLAHYQTPAEIEDLLVAVDTQEASGESSAEALVIRAVLLENLRAYYARHATPQRAAGL
ncbi:hypothetical protein H9L10_09310 [Phycicoccus endophyticus]|uniref:Uncharacterized protein n=1 Tax=Phycicoccus endophyticus TaxID=1690220 RepID=A0A7G9QYV0_9MICO|nr:hypothetical protein [Phycicoccus endophyticus]NHI20429.1 hypothetical protein [Phycicoccus endophyticus]QNN48525.1 hypothetical protein H9L10_09310 [Phycicoccus endophyticus]GGL30901.1 hypothetical protein GCM10012283_11510 [Phycicoccus endophyticus]